MTTTCLTGVVVSVPNRGEVSVCNARAVEATVRDEPSPELELQATPTSGKQSKENTGRVVNERMEPPWRRPRFAYRRRMATAQTLLADPVRARGQNVHNRTD